MCDSSLRASGTPLLMKKMSDEITYYIVNGKPVARLMLDGQGPNFDSSSGPKSGSGSTSGRNQKNKCSGSRNRAISQ
jgi:hypothetical protein